MLRRSIIAVAGLVLAIYPDLAPALHGAAALTVTAHLCKLEQEGVARRDGDVWRPT